VFSAKSDLVVACAEKQVRVWPVKAGSVENPLRGHGEGEAINAAAFSADGSVFIWGASNRKVRVWNGEVSNHRREMNDCQDWVYAVAASPDGKVAAAGAGDGKVYFWNTEDGKLLRSVALGPGAPPAAATTGATK
jgi:WD40 repeat protein